MKRLCHSLLMQITAESFFYYFFIFGMISEKGKGLTGETVRIRKANERKFMIKLLYKLSFATFIRIKTMIKPQRLGGQKGGLTFEWRGKLTLGYRCEV